MDRSGSFVRFLCCVPNGHGRSGAPYPGGVTVSRPHPAPLPRVLVVCTGNVCRSPYAEHRLRALVTGLEVTSRGIDALAGAPMDPPMAQLLAGHGTTAVSFRARQLTAADLDADLVLTMSARQRSVLLEEFPAAARRTGLLGTVPELARLVAEHGALSPSAVAAWSRRAVPPDRDVPDPYRRGEETARAVATLLDTHVELLADLLTRGADGAPAPTPS